MRFSLYILLFAVSIFSAAHASAQVDYNCDVKLTPPAGKVVEVVVERQAKNYLGRDLIVAFKAKYYDGGDPIPAYFMIQDRHDQTDVHVFTSEFNEKWKWDFDFKSKYGPIHVHCE